LPTPLPEAREMRDAPRPAGARHVRIKSMASPDVSRYRTGVFR
jgi:hypothetical protein